MNEPQERTLPHNIEAEKCVLGAILIDNAQFDVAAEVLDSSSFFRDAHRRIWNTMAMLAERRTAIDLVTLKDELARDAMLDEVGGPAYIAGLTDGVPRASNVHHYAKIVRELAHGREVIHALRKGLANAYEEWANPADVAGSVRLELDRLDSRDALDDFKHIGRIYTEDVAPDIEQRLRSATESRPWGISTGYTDIDRYIGGLQPKNLIILAARPSMGKTTLLMNFAQYAAENYEGAAAVFSLEQGREELYYRMLCAEARVEWRYLRRGEVTQFDIGRISAAAEKIGRMNLFINDRADLTAGEMIAKARRLQRERGLSMVGVDYVQLMNERHKPHGMNRNTELGQISRTLKAGAKELNVPFVVLSQIGRDVERRPNKRPQPSDLRDSGNLEQDADVIMFIHRDENEQPTDDGAGTAEIIVAKQRNGPKGTAKLAFIPEYTRFDNLEL